MWINFDATQLAALKRIVGCAAAASGEVHDDTTLTLQLIARYENPACRDPRAIAGASSLTFVREGQCEIDEDAVVSRGDDGAYVMAWLWVSDDDQGDDGPFVPRVAASIRRIGV